MLIIPKTHLYTINAALAERTALLCRWRVRIQHILAATNLLILLKRRSWQWNTNALMVSCLRWVLKFEHTFAHLYYNIFFSNILLFSESKIAVLQASPTIRLQSEISDSIYLQGASYNHGNGISSSISSSSCSVEAPYCNSTIHIDVLDLRLAENDTCEQNITIVDGSRQMILTCQENIQFASYGVETTTNYITVNLLNSMNIDEGYFWLEFKGE